MSPDPSKTECCCWNYPKLSAPSLNTSLRHRHTQPPALARKGSTGCVPRVVMSLPTHLLCAASCTQHISRVDGQGQRPSHFSEMPMCDQGLPLLGQLKPATHRVSPPAPDLKPSWVLLLLPALLSSIPSKCRQQAGQWGRATCNHLTPKEAALIVQSHHVSNFAGVFAGLAGDSQGWEGSRGHGWDPAWPQSPCDSRGCPILCRLVPCTCLFGSTQVQGLLTLSTWASSAWGGIFLAARWQWVCMQGFWVTRAVTGWWGAGLGAPDLEDSDFSLLGLNQPVCQVCGSRDRRCPWYFQTIPFSASHLHTRMRSLELGRAEFLAPSDNVNFPGHLYQQQAQTGALSWLESVLE